MGRVLPPDQSVAGNTCKYVDTIGHLVLNDVKGDNAAYLRTNSRPAISKFESLILVDAPLPVQHSPDWPAEPLSSAL